MRIQIMRQGYADNPFVDWRGGLRGLPLTSSRQELRGCHSHQYNRLESKPHSENEDRLEKTSEIQGRGMRDDASRQVLTMQSFRLDHKSAIATCQTWGH
jgi:hypothetical protein